MNENNGVSSANGGSNGGTGNANGNLPLQPPIPPGTVPTIQDLAAQREVLIQLQNQVAANNAGAPRNCKLPPIWQNSPEAWFLHAESMFVCHNVTADELRYNIVVTALDFAMTNDLLDVLQSPPTSDKYQHLKAQILARFGQTAEPRLRTLYIFRCANRRPQAFAHPL